MTASTVSASTLGRMAVSTKGTGITVNNTETASTVKLAVLKDAVAGKRASAATGMMSSSSNKPRAWTINSPHPNDNEQKLLTMTKNLERAQRGSPTSSCHDSGTGLVDTFRRAFEIE